MFLIDLEKCVSNVHRCQRRLVGLTLVLCSISHLKETHQQQIVGMSTGRWCKNVITLFCSKFPCHISAPSHPSHSRVTIADVQLLSPVSDKTCCKVACHLTLILVQLLQHTHVQKSADLNFVSKFLHPLLWCWWSLIQAVVTPKRFWNSCNQDLFFTCP